MIAIVHSIYSQSVHAPALDARLIDNDAERYCHVLSQYEKQGLLFFVLVYVTSSGWRANQPTKQIHSHC